MKDNAMQAIITKFLPATNTKGSRYKASAQWGSLIVSADHELNPEQNHLAACLALRRQIADANAKQYNTKAENDPWMRPMVCGALPSGEYAHVFKD